VVKGKTELRELDEFWYSRLHDALPNGEIGAIGRFAFGILKEMVKLSLMGHTSFPPSSGGYILEKVICIIQRAKIEDQVLSEIAKYRKREDLMKILRESSYSI